MIKPLFASYLDSEKTNFSESELKPLISKVYQIIIILLKNKYKSKDYSQIQIEEEAIEFTAMLCMKNEKGIPVIILNMKNDLDKNDNDLDFEFMFYSRLKRYLELF